MIRSSSSEKAENSLTMDTIQYNKMIPYCKPEIVPKPKMTAKFQACSSSQAVGYSIVVQSISHAP